MLVVLRLGCDETFAATIVHTGLSRQDVANLGPRNIDEVETRTVRPIQTGDFS